MWAFAGLLSALFLGIYDIFKKTSLTGNAVLPVLFFATLTSTIIFLPVVAGSWLFPDTFLGIGLFSPSLTVTQHLQVLLKSAIVVSSWILAFFAMKHLPVTIFSPIRATGPFWTLIGALLILYFAKWIWNKKEFICWGFWPELYWWHWGAANAL